MLKTSSLWYKDTQRLVRTLWSSFTMEFKFIQQPNHSLLCYSNNSGVTGNNINTTTSTETKVSQTRSSLFLRCKGKIGAFIMFLYVAYLNHRFISYYQNNLIPYVRSPINYLHRDCPVITYETLEQEQKKQQQIQQIFRDLLQSMNNNTITTTTTEQQHNATTTTTVLNTLPSFVDMNITSDEITTMLQDRLVSKPKICVTTLTDAAKADVWQRMIRFRDFNNLLDITWENKVKYCEKHGYHLFNESESLDQSRPPSWSKIVAVQRLLKEEQCDYVFWMDADTIIMNSTIKLESIIPATTTPYDIILTHQRGTSWNAGVWIIKNSMWSRTFLQNWYNMNSFVKQKGLASSGDNAALKHYLQTMQFQNRTEYDTHVVVPSRCHMNSVAKFLTPTEYTYHVEHLEEYKFYRNVQAYHQGDFIAHIAGINNKITTAKMLLEDAR